jgi:hypothetical protein
MVWTLGNGGKQEVGPSCSLILEGECLEKGSGEGCLAWPSDSVPEGIRTIHHSFTQQILGHIPCTRPRLRNSGDSWEQNQVPALTKPASHPGGRNTQ